MKRLALLGILAACAMPGAAFASDFGVDAHVSTLGLGGELNYSINSYFTARVDFNRYNYSYSGTKQQVNYDFDLHLKSYSAMLDWHPFAGTFRVTGGYFSNKNDISALATPQGSYTINGNSYTAAQVGVLSGAITFNPTVPYLGIGWSTLGTSSTGLGIEFDIGALFQGSPTVKLNATGAAASNAQFKSDLAAEQVKLQGDLNSFKTYPVVSFGIAYRF
ncbi:MAG TPA: hypothetical protein VGO35_01410 [Gammaproteobacteria bacterium]|nr:hypothetical protein [Gammaproteobacteria bacterium]